MSNRNLTDQELRQLVADLLITPTQQMHQQLAAIVQSKIAKVEALRQGGKDNP